MTLINPWGCVLNFRWCLVNANLVVVHPMTEQRMAVVKKKKLPARKISLEIYTFLFDLNVVGGYQ